MSRQRVTLRLDVEPERALAACSAAVAQLGWEIVDAGEQTVTGREEPAKLCCVQAPAMAEMEIDGRAEGGSTVTIRGSMPGWGPVAASQLQDRVRALALQLARASD